MDYIKFIKEGYDSQQKYDESAGRLGPYDEVSPEERYSKVIEYIGHMMEECQEARQLVPRRSWKKHEVGFLDNGDVMEEFVAEMYDILLFHRAVLIYAGISPEFFAEVVQRKQNYNNTRKDHKVN